MISLEMRKNCLAMRSGAPASCAFELQKDTSHGRNVWRMVGVVTMRRAHLAAQFDAGSTATLDALEPLLYERTPRGLPE